MDAVKNYQLPGQTGQASNMAGMAGLGSMMAGQNYQNMATNPMATQAYMSPYIQGALAPQLDEARRQSNISGLSNAGQAAKAGAFGGSRFGLQEAERQRNLGTLQDQIYGTGMQNAFQAAQQAQQQSAINEKEADNPNLWVSGWRPAVGWVCGLSLAYSALVEPFMRFVSLVGFNYGGAFPAIDTNLTMQILLGLLGLGAMRSFDKKQGTSK